MSTRRRRILALGGFAALLGIILLLVASVAAYRLVASVRPRCGGSPDEAGFTPADFHTADMDTAPYQVRAYDTVHFPSRDGRVQLSGFYLPAEGGGPVVIVVHGTSDCKRRPYVLLAAGMLHRAGIGALTLDLRNHGDSDADDGLQAAGAKEYQDVLGAWDWLRTEQGVPAARIGLMGYSLGGASVILAAGAEPGVAAVWADSAFADARLWLDARLSGTPIMRPFGALSMAVGGAVSGVSMLASRPMDAAGRLGARPLFLTHGDADGVVPVEHLSLLEAAARAGGTPVETWLVPGADHIQAITRDSGEYERRLAAFFSSALQ